jgi:hypothetical protein
MTPEGIADMETMKMSRETEGPTPGKLGKVEHISITPAENGGHTVEHRMKPKPVHRMGRDAGFGMEYKEPEKHVFGKDEHGEMMEHIAKHLGIKGNWSTSKDGGESDEEDL